MDNLKLTIKNNIPTYSRDIYSWNTIDEFMDLVGEKDGYKTYDKVIQAALDKYKCVKINKLSEVIHLSKPIIMKSGYHLWVDAEQEIKNVPGYGTIENVTVE